jgi:16S rRNA (guanine527-N7)-methyltransferase
MKRLVRPLFLHPFSLHPPPVMQSEVGSSKGQSYAVEASLRHLAQVPICMWRRCVLARPNHPRLQSNLYMHPARIAELLLLFLSDTTNTCHSEQGRRPGEEPAVLSATQLQHISTYIDILQRWNARINLTAIRSEEEIVTRHFGESLFAAHQLFPSASSAFPVPLVKDFDSANDHRLTTNDRVADLGSGAGFPGLPIKLWASEIFLTLIESNQKKAVFLRELVRALTLTDINVINARAEDLDANQTFDLVTLRAVERFAAVLPTAASLVAPSGRLALLIGASQVNEAQTILPEFSWHLEIPIPGSGARTLLVGTK